MNIIICMYNLYTCTCTCVILDMCPMYMYMTYDMVCNIRFCIFPPSLQTELEKALSPKAKHYLAEILALESMLKNYQVCVIRYSKCIYIYMFLWYLKKQKWVNCHSCSGYMITSARARTHTHTHTHTHTGVQ